MALYDTLHMNGGDGGTRYTTNSFPQKTGISKSKHVLDEAIKDTITDNGFRKCFKIADLGCSSGTNSLFVISHIIEQIEEICKEKNGSSHSPNEYQVFLNDLHGNDFNTLFNLLPNFYDTLNNDNNQSKKLCFISVLPGSFYGRLFPSNSLDFVHSSYSLTWLSQFPEGLESNKENIHITKGCPSEVLEAYKKQHHRDFSTFLSLRAEEMVTGARMVLTFVGGRLADDEEYVQFTILANTLVDMVAEGVIKEADLHSFNLPIYTPSKEEVEGIVRSEGSFNLEKLERFLIPWDANDGNSNATTAEIVANFTRAFTEPIMAAQFGSSIMDEMYERFGHKLGELQSSTDAPPFSNMVISLCKK
ncbi:hypothetical protein MIMGU_mgv1a008864mg [Erythranthe guttata]|uniref:Uncharacterized protein n=2 Tax=Erythranthe guttata TaxID=4155 RepID=A0A022QPM0_ERYGU|nr:PREDICTED: benzoate carboxyl methyltransferase-like [Erythranthe guttata]EYU29901.1 hypothetical protein MIMGU_mgv1a008864mg [Erythranthe guttata]|eukprot:XP_012846313.1 PREDICTED: benzoate carboxyl methyltransferase-like [Erythranthe guttata]